MLAVTLNAEPIAFKGFLLTTLSAKTILVCGLTVSRSHLVSPIQASFATDTPTFCLVVTLKAQSIGALLGDETSFDFTLLD